MHFPSTSRTAQTLSVVCALTLATTLSSCSSDPDPATADDSTVNVLASFYPLQFVSERVGGPDVTVTNLTPPAAEPHDIELSPSAVRSVGEADLVVYLSTFQPATDDAIAAQSPPHVIDAMDAAGLTGDDDSLDPHFWLDPTRLAAVAHEVADTLGEMDPEHAADFESRADALDVELTALDAEYIETLEPCAGATLVTSHEAFGYLADRYGLVQVGISGIDPDAEPSPARLREVREIVERDDVSTLYFEVLVSPKVTQTLADDLGVQTDVLDPLESISDDQDDYLTVMERNLVALKDGLTCS
ncbi:metal ABC transporter substrate-binding protein [Sanguibacter antarcticus]|uniref:Zinc transport system substrate-binding protein n=1 Tax=Sanguibacter antarcticus TaxID=372484 RepID=A0A2A9E3I1_9MICO|nr:metal ABC transporter substrate-binding protein [Sanguibacter antarcticus]PFG33206.1 zinc transport system substrate-binding protein [Sanguibacter antarcticus]